MCLWLGAGILESTIRNYRRKHSLLKAIIHKKKKTCRKNSNQLLVITRKNILRITRNYGVLWFGQSVSLLLVWWCYVCGSCCCSVTTTRCVSCKKLSISNNTEIFFSITRYYPITMIHIQNTSLVITSYFVITRYFSRNKILFG